MPNPSLFWKQVDKLPRREHSHASSAFFGKVFEVSGYEAGGISGDDHFQKHFIIGVRKSGGKWRAGHFQSIGLELFDEVIDGRSFKLEFGPRKDLSIFL